MKHDFGREIVSFSFFSQYQTQDIIRSYTKYEDNMNISITVLDCTLPCTLFEYKHKRNLYPMCIFIFSMKNLEVCSYFNLRGNVFDIDTVQHKIQLTYCHTIAKYVTLTSQTSVFAYSLIVSTRKKAMYNGSGNRS